MNLPFRVLLFPTRTMETLPHTHSCFVCGDANPVGLQLRFVKDGAVVRTRFTPATGHAGFRGIVHGGILSTVLDEIMVWACAVNSGHFGFCVELNVRFHQPSVPGEELAVSAELVSNHRNRLFAAKAEVRNPDGKLLASSTGKYMALRKVDEAALLDDFVGSPAVIESWKQKSG